jgi:hypothetical protein
MWLCTASLAMAGLSFSRPLFAAQRPLASGYVVSANGSDAPCRALAVGQPQIFAKGVGIVQGPAALGRLYDLVRLGCRETVPTHAQRDVDQCPDWVLIGRCRPVPEP